MNLIVRHKNNVRVRFIVPIFQIIILAFVISCQSFPNADVVEAQSIASQETIPSETKGSKVSESVQSNETLPVHDPSSNLADKPGQVEYPQLSDTTIESIVLDTIPGSFVPVTNNDGHIKIIYRDLDQNGYKDAFFLVVKRRENMDARFSDLSDVSYLLKNERQPVDFFLAVYLQLQGTMISMYRIPVGSGVVISDFSILSIRKGEVIPLGINISFQTVKGRNSEWIIFSSYNKFSLFSMIENISSHSNYYDLDGDDIIDIIGWEDGLEEGTGYETYLTWYKWNGREYREYLSTNVVRNLNEFLEQSRLYLSFGQMNEFFRYSLNQDDYRKYQDSDRNMADWINKIFRTVPGSNSQKDMLTDSKKFRSIIFPKIFENPYSPAADSSRICNINIRFEYTDGSSFVRTARVRMNPNPFRKPQFSFYLE